jgi:hypothetical protein
VVLADRIYEDKSGKKIIAGTFNQILHTRVAMPEPEMPDGSKRLLLPGGTDPGCPSVYISLTDIVNGTEISLQFVDVSRNNVLFGTAYKIEAHDRLATVEIIAPLPPIFRMLTGDGTFSFDVVWNGEILGSHRLIVKTNDPEQRSSS